ncbi:MAG: hypothetical protein BRD44_08275 [Bacteroidetes bacterium QS_7_67_15]|nr:MAG: hypothetical protein BRD44_08275 [Bacteroidetes bacterium QS_7_67_15]
MALWAFVLGYVVSSMIQVFVAREPMQHAMGEAARMAEQAFFKIDYTFFLNIAFLVISVLMAGLYWNQRSGGHGGGEIPGSVFVEAAQEAKRQADKAQEEAQEAQEARNQAP